MDSRSAKEHFEGLLGSLVDSIGLPEVPVLDVHDHCALSFDSGLIMNLTGDFSRGTFLLHGALVQLSASHEVLENLLKLSWSRVRENEGCGLALNESEPYPVLYRCVSLEGLSSEAFKDVLAHFISVMELYQNSKVSSSHVSDKLPSSSGSLRV